MMHRIYHGNCLDVIPHLGLFQMVFADVPDNIGRDYNEYDDNLPVQEYLNWMESCFERFISVAPTVWVSFNAKWTIPFGVIADRIIKAHGVVVKPCVQTFTFGVQQQADLKNCHRPLWRFMRPGSLLFPDQSREPSWRLLNGDPRADPRGAVPSDWFDHEFEPQFQIVDTVFDYPRVTGNSKEKRRWHDNQMPERLLERCIKLSTPEGGKVLDPFGGTGTTLRVGKRLGRAVTTIDIDSMYCTKMAEENSLEILRI